MRRKVDDERRRHVRKPVQIPAKIEVDGDGPEQAQTLAVTCADLSLGGAFLNHDTPLPFGAKFRLALELPGRELKLNAVVRWAGDTGMGVQFGSIGIQDTYALTEFLATISR